MITENVMSLNEFQGFLSDTLGITEVALTPDASFLNDLGIDSLKLVDLMLQFELQLGMSVPSEVAWEIQTVEDAYKYYIRQFQSGFIGGE
jgi:acyl carrier protein